MPAMLLPLAIKFAPAILGGLASLFGRKKKDENAIPEWFKPYLEKMQGNSAAYQGQIDEIDARNPIRKGLRKASMGVIEGDYTKPGNIISGIIDQLRARQATTAKASENDTRMNFAAAGMDSGLLQNVLAQQASQREQGNELANADAQTKASFATVDAYNNMVNTERDQKYRLLSGMSGNDASIAGQAGQAGRYEQSRPQEPNFLQRILAGAAASAPGILQGLGEGGGKGETSMDGSSIDTPMNELPTSNMTSQSYAPLSHIPRPSTPAPTDMLDRSISEDAKSAIPSDMDDWLGKYFKPKNRL